MLSVFSSETASARSMPVQNDLPSPLRITQRTSLSYRMSRQISRSSSDRRESVQAVGMPAQGADEQRLTGEPAAALAADLLVGQLGVLVADLDDRAGGHREQLRPAAAVHR